MNTALINNEGKDDEATGHGNRLRQGYKDEQRRKKELEEEAALCIVYSDAADERLEEMETEDFPLFHQRKRKTAGARQQPRETQHRIKQASTILRLRSQQAKQRSGWITSPGMEMQGSRDHPTDLRLQTPVRAVLGKT